MQLLMYGKTEKVNLQENYLRMARSDKDELRNTMQIGKEITTDKYLTSELLKIISEEKENCKKILKLCN